MMVLEIVQIVGLGMITTVLVVLLRPQRPEIAIQLAIIASIIIFMLLLSKISAVLDLLNIYASRVNIDNVYLSTLIKIIGIAYIAEFGSEICKDAGEVSIASKIELAGKVIIVVLAVPIITSLLELVIRIMP